MDEININKKQIMKERDGAIDDSINYSQAMGLLAACNAIIMLVQSGAANKKMLQIFYGCIQYNLGDERSLEDADVFDNKAASAPRTHRELFSNVPPYYVRGS